MIVKINAGLYRILHAHEDKIQMKFQNLCFGLTKEKKIHYILYIFCIHGLRNLFDNLYAMLNFYNKATFHCNLAI